ncbi:MAG TPA: prenyltransferase/squalene oxidase repeat-containing protein [Tepidisphaeraceae bacterium]|nr:prenyltransferase/squalene oxidase repeat-containing protein [Tepidisphaeraceae bacterium]
MKRIHGQVLVAAIGAAIVISPLAMLHAADPSVPSQAAPVATHDPAGLAQSAIDKGLAFLKSQQQPDGSWQGENDPPAMTAIALRAFVGAHHFNAEDPFIKKGFDKLLTYQKDDGSISSDVLATYNTAIAISALAKSNDPAYKKAVDKAVAYLRSIEWTDKIEGVANQSKKVDPKDPNYGGWGYGKRSRADLSNAQMAIEALHDAGLKPGDPAYAAAITFISRAQNRSESNDQAWASDDGGFIYTPASGGLSNAGEYTGPNGQRMLRSYGSMTYAGLKSMMYAGLTKDDPRVKAAWEWIRHNWTVDQNPGIQYADPKDPKAVDYGLYYYYHTLARAMRAYGEPVITDTKGNKHDWRAEFVEKLAGEQQADGSYHGVQKWMENRPQLSTSFAVLSLEEAADDMREHPVKK